MHELPPGMAKKKLGQNTNVELQCLTHCIDIQSESHQRRKKWLYVAVCMINAVFVKLHTFIENMFKKVCVF